MYSRKSNKVTAYVPAVVLLADCFGIPGSHGDPIVLKVNTLSGSNTSPISRLYFPFLAVALCEACLPYCILTSVNSVRGALRV